MNKYWHRNYYIFQEGVTVKKSLVFALFLVNLSAWLEPFIYSYIMKVISTSYGVDPLLGFLFIAYMIWGILLYFSLEESKRLCMSYWTRKLYGAYFLLLNLIAAFLTWFIWHHISILTIVLVGIYACRVMEERKTNEE